MYTTHLHSEQNILEISNSKETLKAKLFLNDGGSLQELTLKGHPIIQDLAPLKYDVTYASSILFPFANRIKDGQYSFKGQAYQLNKNQTEEQNALHGFVYNKTFKLLDEQISDDSVKIALIYVETEETQGFPYTYKIRLDYEFFEDRISLGVTVTNSHNNAFPFTLGWHPYFVSDNLYDSKIVMDSTQKLILGDRNITTGVANIDNVKSFPIKDQQLDDCWILNSDKVVFETPKYSLRFSSSSKNNFLQAYTPPKANTIAIEPTTGVSDSFNNKIGLEVLQPNESCEITWNLSIN